jgi:tetratricopeptide (TPR) repeat protein
MSRGRHLLVLDDIEEAGTEAIAETRALLSAWDTTLGGRAVLVFHTRRADFQDLIGANRVTVRGLSVEAGSDFIVARLGGAEHARQAVGGDVSETSQVCHGHPRTIGSAASPLRLGQRWADLKTEFQQLSGEGALAVNDEMLGRVIARLEQRAPAVRDLLDAWTVLEDGCQESIWRRLAVADPRSNPAKGQLDVALGELHGASLIDRYEVSGVGRCVMHPLLVAHLRRRHDALSEQRTRQIVKTQLAEQSRLASADDYPTGEAGNIKRALHLARRLGLDRDIVRYGIAAAGDQQLPLVRRGPWQLARDVLDVAVSGAEAISDNDRAAQFLLVRGTVEYRLANFEAARQAYERAASLATGTGHTSLRLLALRGMGQVLYRVGELDEAERLYQSVRQLAGEDPVAVDIDHRLGP